MPRAGESITIGDFDVLRPAIPDVHASTVRALPGWWDTPDSRDGDQERQSGDGDFPSVRSYGSRMVTIQGDVSSRSRAAMFAFRDRVSGLLASGPEYLTVEGHGPSQRAQVYRSGGLEWSEKSPVAATWQLTVKAPDPRKYGLVLHDSGQVGTGSAVEVAHAGNYPALPRLNVFSADFPNGYTVYRDGESGYNTRIFQPLTSGMVHSVDFATGVSSIQGTTTTGMLGRSRGIELDPYRLNTLNVVPYESSNTATVRWYWRDTWI